MATAQAVRVVPVYAQDGTTVVGQFAIGGTSRSTSPHKSAAGRTAAQWVQAAAMTAP